MLLIFISCSGEEDSRIQETVAEHSAHYRHVQQVCAQYLETEKVGVVCSRKEISSFASGHATKA